MATINGKNYTVSISTNKWAQFILRVASNGGNATYHRIAVTGFTTSPTVGWNIVLTNPASGRSCTISFSNGQPSADGSSISNGTVSFSCGSIDADQDTWSASETTGDETGEDIRTASPY